MKKYKVGKDISFQGNRKKSFFKDRKVLLGLAAFIILIMVTSVLTLMFEKDNDNQQEIDYNGYKFAYDPQSGWATTINGQKVGFELLPTDVVNLSQNSFFGFGLGKTYVTFKPNEFSENSYEIGRIIAFLTFSGRQSFPACSQEEGCGDLPVVSCSENSTENVIYIYIGNETKITSQGNCLKLEARPGDELKVMTLFVYKLLGIVR